MKCRLCLERDDLVDAHVVPAGFFRRLRDGPEAPRLLSNSAGQHPKRAPTGVYDPGIVCAGCEPLFGPWDQYAQELLSEPPPGRALKYGNKVVGFESKDAWRYDLLKLFFISLAWRASVSTHAFYQRINLGPFEEIAKTMLLERRPGDSEEFSVVLARFTDPVGRVLLDPHTDRIESVDHIRMYLGGYVAYIKTDNRSAPGWMVTFQLKPNAPLKIIGRDITQSKELRIMQSILEQPQNRLHKRT